MSSPNRYIQYTPDCDFNKTNTKWFEPCHQAFPHTKVFLKENPISTQPSTDKNSQNPKAPKSPRELSWRSFQTMTHIDSGSFSTVLKVKSLATGKFYAAKVINKKMARDVKIIDRVKREIEILFRLSHPGIIKLFYYFEESEDLILLLELAEDGSLFRLKHKIGSFNEKTVCKLIYQLLLILGYLKKFSDTEK
jgi:hypothetical protein